jgi:DNA modification methylase
MARPLRLEAAPVDAPSRLRSADARPGAPPQGFFTVHQGDARRLDLFLSEFSSARHPLLTTTITSPPYGALKDYGHPDQIGHAEPFDEYLMEMRRVFRSLHTHTKRNGSLWLVVDTLRTQGSDADVWAVEPLPFQLAQEAGKGGWVLREIIIWLKDKTLPWSSRGRLRNTFEYVLFFVKSQRYKYKIDRLRQPGELEQWWVRYPERYNPQGKAPTNVWPIQIPVQGSWTNTNVKHACPLPPDLVERMVQISSDRGDVVFDPFAGSGVVVAEAQRLERKGLGLELVQDHIDAFHQAVLPEVTERRGKDLVQELQHRSEALRETILKLRAVKYPKSLYRTAREIDPGLPASLAIYAFRRKRSIKRIDLEIKVIVKDSDLGRSGDWMTALARASKRRPASKFGVLPKIELLPQSKQGTLHRGRSLWAYVGGNVHSAAGRCRAGDVDEWMEEPSRHDLPLIVSNVYVDETPRRLASEDDLP